MKKCITILLIVFLFLNSGGFIIIFYQAQQSVKMKMLLSIREGEYPADKLVRFIIDKNQFHKNVNGFVWSDEKEFEYNGVLYDVIKFVNYNDEIILFALNDVSEEKIIKNFNDEINDLASGKLNNSKYKTSLINLISQALCIYPFHLNRPAGLQKYLSSDIRNYPSVVVDIPLPPPKFT